MERSTHPFISETELRVRYQETDQMGVVYHANYLVWFEVGRTELIRQFGYAYKQLEERGLLLPVVDIHCKYMRPARYDDPILVQTWVEEVSSGKVVFGYEVSHRETKERLVTGRSTHLWVNNEMKRVNIKRAFPEVYELLVKICAKERG